MRRLSSILSDLIVLAEEAVTRPMMIDQRGGGPRFVSLAEEVRHADAQPAADVRVTDAALVMVIAIEKIRASTRDESMPWLMVAGAMLPMLRADAFQAFKSERGQA